MFHWTENQAEPEAIFPDMAQAMAAAMIAGPPADVSHIMASERRGGAGWRVAGVRRGPPLTPIFLAGDRQGETLGRTVRRVEALLS